MFVLLLVLLISHHTHNPRLLATVAKVSPCLDLPFLKNVSTPKRHPEHEWKILEYFNLFLAKNIFKKRCVL